MKLDSGQGGKSRVSKQRRSSSGGKLQLRARAARQAETRERITRAAVELHEKRGVLNTTITAIAERAGVERLTVYRHFPDEASLHQACQQHFFADHPLPDPTTWIGIPNFARRLELALTELYQYWDQTHDMFDNVLRDHEVDPKRSGAGVISFISDAREALLDGQHASGRRGRLLRAIVGHAVHFYTWRSLVRDQGLSNADAVSLMCRTVALAAE
jgi:AcrR family transcriptional regulator